MNFAFGNQMSPLPPPLCLANEFPVLYHDLTNTLKCVPSNLFILTFNQSQSQILASELLD